jgi:GNAT superfamily N-acetyltransferase
VTTNVSLFIAGQGRSCCLPAVTIAVDWSALSDVRVRPVRPGDGPGCARAWMDAGRHYAAIDSEQFQLPVEAGLVDWFERLHANLAADRLVLVACVQEDVAGFVSAVLNSPEPDAQWELIRQLGRTRAFVAALVVAEHYRRRGVGTALMTEMERWARQQGATSVSLRTNLRSPLSMPFYEERMGYTREGAVFRKRLRS